MVILRNKKGIVRVVEATVAVLVIFAVLFIISGQDTDDDVQSLSALIEPLLDEISKNETLRQLIVVDSLKAKTDILAFIGAKIDRTDLGYDLEICEASEICSITKFPESRDGNVYSEYRVISTYLENNQDTLNLKKVKIFLWRK
jgi:hypothetical protein